MHQSGGLEALPRRRLWVVRFDDRAVRWIERVLGPDATVVRARRMRGGISSIVHEVSVRRAHGLEHVVLRRTPLDDEVVGHDPAGETRREAGMLQRLNGRAFAPAVLGHDFSGDECGVPSMLMTRLPGRPTVAPTDVTAWIDGLTTAVRMIKALRDNSDELGRFQPWFSLDFEPPVWCRAPSLWADVAKDLKTSLPRVYGPDQLVHRDLHPGNVLFHRGKLSGIVDWTHACRGPVEADVSRCRVEVAILAGMDAADLFLTNCADMIESYDRRWDALVALELAPWIEGLTEFNRLGASLDVASIARTCDDLVIAAAG